MEEEKKVTIDPKVEAGHKLIADLDQELVDQADQTRQALDEIDRRYRDRVAQRKAQEVARQEALTAKFGKNKKALSKPSTKRLAFKDDSWAKSLAVASSAGFTLLVAVGACLWLGNQLDAYLGTEPIGTVWGGLIGGFGGLYLMYKELTR